MINTKEIIEQVRRYINESDPWYLIEIGAPIDEYDAQIHHVVSLLVNQSPTVEDLSLELHKIFDTKEHSLDAKKITELVEKLKTIEINKIF